MCRELTKDYPRSSSMFCSLFSRMPKCVTSVQVIQAAALNTDGKVFFRDRFEQNSSDASRLVFFSPRQKQISISAVQDQGSNIISIV